MIIKFDVCVHCLNWLLVVHTGNLDIGLLVLFAYFLSVVCARIMPIDTVNFSNLNCSLD